MEATAIIDANRRGRSLRSDIQGLRAIAVLSVVFFHANADWLPGGFVGVDIFFVISGYLIAGILLSEMDRGEYSLTGFYERRVRRLFPALFVMLAIVLIVAAFTLAPTGYRELGETALSTIFFYSNFAFFDLSGYFDQEAHFKPLLHTWSLAVEEQFYLAFPLFLSVIVRFARSRLRAILGVAAIASLGACVWAMRNHGSAAFYLTPFRGYELLIGAILAGLPFPIRAPTWVRNALSIAGLLLISGSLLLLNREMPFPGFAALPPCLGAAAVIFAGADQPSLGGRWISGPAFTFFGALSYSLYLWHWPVFVLGQSVLLHAPTLWQSILLVALAIGLATLSRRYIEQPFLKRGQKLHVLAIGAAAMAVGAAITFPIFYFGGLPGRFSPSALQLFSSQEDYSPHRWSCHDFLGDQTRAYAQNCVLGVVRAAPHVAVWADSGGVELADALADRLALDGQSLLQLTASNCPPGLRYSPFDQPRCASHNAAILPALAGDPRIQTVVVVANYLAYPHKDWRRIFSGEARALALLAAHGKRIILVYPIPVFDYDVPTALGILNTYGAPLSDESFPREVFNAEAAEIVEFLDRERAQLGATAAFPADLLCDPTTCYGHMWGRGVLYFNHNHISESAARLLAARLPIDAYDDHLTGVTGVRATPH